MIGALTRDLGRLEGRLAAARTRIAAGEAPDLQDVDKEVERLCRAIGALPVPQTRTLKPRLVSLLSDINALSGNLQEAIAEIGGHLSETGRRRSAVSAYGKGGSAPRNGSGR